MSVRKNASSVVAEKSTCGGYSLSLLNFCNLLAYNHDITVSCTHFTRPGKSLCYLTDGMTCSMQDQLKQQFADVLLLATNVFFEIHFLLIHWHLHCV